MGLIKKKKYIKKRLKFCDVKDKFKGLLNPTDFIIKTIIEMD